MRVLVCGGRDYTDYDKVFETLSNYDLFVANITKVITGAARGADSLAIKAAHALGLKLESYPADWTKHRKAAGPIRNQQMLDDGKPDLVIAFPGGNGTADMVRRAKKANIKVIEIE